MTLISAAMSRTMHVGIGEMAVSDDPAAVLCAPNLGSCLGIAVYDPVRRIGGLVHCLLPASTRNPEKAAAQPQLFVDTGLAVLLNRLLGDGSAKRDLVISVAGGAKINDQGNLFEIGKKNYTVLKKVLWKNELLLTAEHAGGDHPRTITLDIGTGRVAVRALGQIIELVGGY